jgi:endonuclease YncB( thermonuclease family)
MASFDMRAFLAGILFLGLTASSEAAAIEGTASVVDGDTLEVRGERIRLYGIDAPESSQVCKRSNGKQWRCGQQAALALSEHIGRRPVSCDGRGKDSYGRTIAVCSVNGVDLNKWLVAEGWAVAYRKYSLDYVDAETEARVQGVGIWSGSFDMPGDYRKQRWADASSQAPDPNCPIKGNINRDGERIYHTPWGSRSYKRTKISPEKGERWFCDEAEAVAAGWRAPFN